MQPFSRSRDIYTYILELVCHDKQNSSQSFSLGARIVQLGQFKAQKVEKLHEEDHLANFKPDLWQTGFFECSKEWYHYQKQLVVSKMIV